MEVRCGVSQRPLSRSGKPVPTPRRNSSQQTVAAVLQSGVRAWVYVDAQRTPPNNWWSVEVETLANHLFRSSPSVSARAGSSA
jgi:hypothetical protein